MSDSRKDNGFVLQAGILAVAGIISRIIGLLYRSPLTAVVGTLGMGYYQKAYNYYTIVLLISSYSIPSAISKVIAQKLAVKEYRNAHRIFLCALGYVLVVGGVASMVLFFGAGFFLDSETVPVLRTFAPTIFIYGILGVLRGYFQAHRSMVQTSVSQILEQIVNAAVSVGAAWLLIQHFMGTLEMPAGETERVSRATYGAIGSALGTGAGVAVAMVFMLGIYALNRRMIHRRIQHDKHTNMESYGEIVKTITMVVTPFILSTAVYNLSDVINSTLYTEVLPDLKEVDSIFYVDNYGVFSSLAQTISKIPIAFATAMAAAMIPTVTASIAARRFDETKTKIGVAVKSTMVISIPSAVGLFVLAKPVTALLFPSQSDETLTYAGMLLMSLALSVVFYALSTLNSNVLQGLGRVNVPIVNAAIALAVQTVTVFVLLQYTALDLYSLAIANTVYSGMMCIMNQWAVRRAVGYRQELVKSFGIPFLASAFMGLAAWAVYEGVYLMTKSMRVAVLPAIAVAVAVYFVMMLALRGLTEEELRGFPKGYLLVKMAKKCRLLS
ncbi:MAG: polysaccharide biosynthesis protein [Acetatifactor sp.]|nr:polysaccharide biosynthesis protein [Acetatifactor sp.]